MSNKAIVSRHELCRTYQDVAVSGTDSRLVFANKTFANRHRNAKFAKVFTRERNPLYGKSYHDVTDVIIQLS